MPKRSKHTLSESMCLCNWLLNTHVYVVETCELSFSVLHAQGFTAFPLKEKGQALAVVQQSITTPTLVSDGPGSSYREHTSQAAEEDAREGKPWWEEASQAAAEVAASSSTERAAAGAVGDGVDRLAGRRRREGLSNKSRQAHVVSQDRPMLAHYNVLENPQKPINSYRKIAQSYLCLAHPPRLRLEKQE